VRHVPAEPAVWWRHRQGPLFDPRHFRHAKDPCPVHDGERWHLFGTGERAADGRWRMLHATASSLDGPWHEVAPAVLVGVDGGCVGAPGVVAQANVLHLFAQTHFAALGTSIEHLVSDDGGDTFVRRRTALSSRRWRAGEAGVYDASPGVVDGRRYLAYAGQARVGSPDLYLARSTSGSWEGPWKRLGRIVGHAEVPHHNQRGRPGYEWGLEGPQVVQLPDGTTLLNAVCFLPAGSPGTRQRVFFATAAGPTGPYRSLGPVLEPPPTSWEAGENGHGTVVVEGDRLWLFYQARSGAGGSWRYGSAWCFWGKCLTRNAPGGYHGGTRERRWSS
jgi:hypothetical protein